MNEHLCERCERLVSRDRLFYLDRQRPKDKPPNLVHIAMFDQVYKAYKEAQAEADKWKAEAAKWKDRAEKAESLCPKPKVEEVE